jgi:CheY-like chemotaxis protein
MIPAAYLCKFQRECSARTAAKLFVTVGAASVAAVTIVRFSATGVRFGSATFGVLTGLLMICVLAFLSYSRLVAGGHNRWSFWNADDVLIWQDQFADTEEEAPLILLAATDVFMRSALDFHFTRAGFRVQHAANCDEALMKTRLQPGAVLLDLSMPNGNAFYCLRDIRYASPATKIIALTRKCHPNDSIICRKLGASDSMPKPFDPNDAVTKVVRVLNNEIVEEIALSLSA